jgi:V8-like Glu-specific endopeptidase
MSKDLSMHTPKILAVAATIATISTAAPATAQTAGIGKLFTSAGTCSASVISGKNIIVTAAHCCYDRSKNEWIGGWSFAPGYNNGNAPYGMFPWRRARVLTSWVNNGNRRSDVCVISLGNNSARKPVTYYTGWYGRAWNYSPNQNMRSFGYPGNLANGQTLQQCAAPSSAQPSSCGANVVKMACNMTYGSSGGPWFRNFGTGYHVNSTVSGWDGESCTGGFGKVFNGPRFTSGNIVPLCNDEGC